MIGKISIAVLTVSGTFCTKVEMTVWKVFFFKKGEKEIFVELRWAMRIFHNSKRLRKETLQRHAVVMPLIGVCPP